MRPAVSLLARSISPALECRILSLITYPGEPDERSAKKRFIVASPADVGEVAAVHPDLSIPEQHVAAEAGEDVDYVAMPKSSCQWASVLLYLRKAVYDIKLVDSDDFTLAGWHITASRESWLRHQARRQRRLHVGHVTG